MNKLESIPGTEIQIDTCNPGKFEWKSFWESDISNYKGTYFDELKPVDNSRVYKQDYSIQNPNQIEVHVPRISEITDVVNGLFDCTVEETKMARQQNDDLYN